MKPIRPLLLLSLASLALLPACASRPAPPTVDTKAAVVNAASVAAPLIEGSARIAVPLILTRNPGLADRFTLTTTAAATILSAARPTAEGFAAALRVAFPDLAQAQAVQIGAALESAYAAGAALFQAQTGRPLVLTSILQDPQYQAAADVLITSLVRGVTNGLADYRATLPAS
ncbi:MAG: hypothetical protein IPL39_16250 [Opitutaceae bacterium]|nr:hypothetical protein [Opitutaceae bacterium]